MIVTRFAPSPTGLLHAGNYRTALFAYLFAVKNGGKFLLRIEDTDKARSKKEFEDNILESLAWLGLGYEGLCRQSERTAIYTSYIKKLIDADKAYISKEEIKNEGDRAEVIRFRNPGKKVSFNDVIRGKVEFDTTELGDFVIARSMEEPVFHLAVVVDDFEMGVTHVLRGEDHISNTPRHILIQEALGFPVPSYAHLPLLLSTDRSKLSKRKGALPITAYRDQGFLKEAIVNYMALLGWNPGTTQEILSMDELVKLFDLEQIQKSGAVFSEEKIKWVNKQYINKMSDADFKAYAMKFIPENSPIPAAKLERIIPVLKDRIHTFGEVTELLSPTGELGSLWTSPSFEKEKLLWKQDSDLSVPKSHLAHIASVLEGLSEETFASPETVKQTLWGYAEEKGRGSVLWPMRFSLSGKEKSPDPFTLAHILGKEETISRIKRAHDIL
ncbi:MAG: glutamate--tRNA ligase [Patescibacteria group bacterium]